MTWIHGPKEANSDYIDQASAPSKDVVLLGSNAFTNLVDSIKLRIGHHGIPIKHCKKQIRRFKEPETGATLSMLKRLRQTGSKLRLLARAEKEIESLGV